MFDESTAHEPPQHALDHWAQGAVGACEALGPHSQQLLEVLLHQTVERRLTRSSRLVDPTGDLHAADRPVGERPARAGGGQPPRDPPLAGERKSPPRAGHGGSGPRGGGARPARSGAAGGLGQQGRDADERVAGLGSCRGARPAPPGRRRPRGRPRSGRGGPAPGGRRRGRGPSPRCGSNGLGPEERLRRGSARGGTPQPRSTPGNAETDAAWPGKTGPRSRTPRCRTRISPEEVAETASCIP